MDTVDFTRFALAFFLVIGLIGLMGWGLRRFGGARLLGGQEEGGRLRVVETRWLDPKRRLVLIRRDDAEHLLLLADGRETLIESGIPGKDGHE